MVAVLLCGGFLHAQEIERSVVKIVNQQNVFNWYAPWNSGSTGRGSGSGFVISKNRIMTNAHVAGNSAMLLVFFHNDPTPYPAKVTAIGHDCDLALLELLDPKRLEGVPPLEFDGLPEIRSQVFTCGYPMGGKRLSITAGVVSRIEMQQYVHSGVDRHLLIQTDAAINPGNSGGPVIQDSRVVGVAFQANRRLENMGSVIPTKVIEHFLTDLADGTYDGFPHLGIVSANLENPAARDYAGMSEGETGIRIDRLIRGCSTESILKPGDIVT
ncbi:MAG: serine protease, partial [Verrucomicrobiota bacterium]